MTPTYLGAPLAFWAALVAVAPTPSPVGPCSSDSFTIEGTALNVQFCARIPATPQAEGSGGVTLSETLTVKGQAPLVRAIGVESLANETSVHAIDDVPLARLGMAKTLHLTVVYRQGAVWLEHALLLPGAVLLK